jgi:hypothetical protein
MSTGSSAGVGAAAGRRRDVKQFLLPNKSTDFTAAEVRNEATERTLGNLQLPVVESGPPGVEQTSALVNPWFTDTLDNLGDILKPDVKTKVTGDRRCRLGRIGLVDLRPEHEYPRQLGKDDDRRAAASDHAHGVHIAHPALLDEMVQSHAQIVEREDKAPIELGQDRSDARAGVARSHDVAWRWPPNYLKHRFALFTVPGSSLSMPSSRITLAPHFAVDVDAPIARRVALSFVEQWALS